MSSTAPALYTATLVPALHRIQDEFGYLKREAMLQLSQDSGQPLHRLQAVASFFPLFRLTPPPRVTLRVCRDMACHVAGAVGIIQELKGMAGENFAVEGVSCLGRCDRQPATFVQILGVHHERYYLGRTAAQLKEIVEACLRNAPPPDDHDIDLPYARTNWKVDPYGEATPDYAGVRRALAARDASIAVAEEALRVKTGWPAVRIEKFRHGCISQMRDHGDDPEVLAAVRCWQTDSDWAKGPTMGGWSEALLKEFTDADLRGMGGAGIPAIQKWRDIRDAIRAARKRDKDDRGFIVVNGDESEPATFKDRELLLRTPHLIIEGVILAGLFSEATQGFIYIRHEYPEQIEACRVEILRAEKLGVCGVDAFGLGRTFHMSVFTSPGGYICGEQSALIEAMSDHRGEPRNMPPKLETNGLIDLPTLVSNVETYAWVPYIIVKGGKACAELGTNTWKGGRFFSISGDVKRPGVYEVPMGMTLRELLFGEAYCQGMSGNRKFKAFAPSGPSGGFLPARLTADAGLPRDHLKNKVWLAIAGRRGFDPAATEMDLLDLELELNVFRGLSPTQALGAGLVVYGDDRDMAEQSVNSLEFFRNESCGKCVPCRMGSQKMASLGAHLLTGNIDATRWKNEIVPLVKDMGKAIELASICGLGRSVPVPLRTVMNYFPADLAKHLSGKNGQTAH